MLAICEIVGDRPTNVLDYPKEEREYLRAAVIERKERERKAMPDI